MPTTLMRLLSVVGHPMSFNVSGGKPSSARSILARFHDVWRAEIWPDRRWSQLPVEGRCDERLAAG
ncbi:hypothetical protein AGR1C_Cc40301 [Agrobacterium fabacearum TT111]|nr:hypothetical protein AGR1C_Cc40301 [Agrobacterium fabacearum TT111]